jgi:FMN phosphatase YigB (HAD superfamily)
MLRPDRRIFRAAEDMLKDLLPESVEKADFEKLYVGDDLDKDIKGARAAGWHSLMLHQGEETARNIGSNSHPRWQVQVESGEWTDILRNFKELGQWAPRNAEGNITYDMSYHPYEFERREQVANWKQAKLDAQETWRKKQVRGASCGAEAGGADEECKAAW